MVNERKFKAKKRIVDTNKLKSKFNKSKKQNRNSCAINIENPNLESIITNDVIKPKSKHKISAFKKFIDLENERNGCTKAAKMKKRNNVNNLQAQAKLNGSKNKASSQTKKCNKVPKGKLSLTNNKTNSCNNTHKSRQEMAKTKKVETKQNYSKSSRNQHMSQYNMDFNLDQYIYDSNDNDVTQKLDSNESMCFINFRNMKSIAGEEHSSDSSETTDSNLNSCLYKDKFYEYGNDDESESQSNYDSDTDDYSSSLDEDHMQHFQLSGDNDDNYKMPKYFPEDPEEGTTKKRDCTLSDDVHFNSDADEAQIIELREQDIFKATLQPHACNEDELEKLVYKSNKTFPPSITDAFAIGNDCLVLDLTNGSANEISNLNSSSCEKFKEESSMHFNTSSTESVCNLKQQGSSLATSNQEVDFFLEDDDDEVFNCTTYLEEFETEVLEDTQCYYLEDKHSSQMYLTYNDVKNVENSNEYQSSEHLAENIDLNDKPSILIADVANYDESQVISEDEMDLDENSFSSMCSNLDFCTEVEKFEVPQVTIANASHVEKARKVNVVNSLFAKNKKMHVNEVSKTIPSKHTQIAKCYPESCQSTNSSSSKFFAAILDNMVIAVAKKPFYIYGTLRLTLISGAVQVYGHSPNPNEEIEIFSPRGCCTIQVASQPSNASKDWQACLEPYKTYFSEQDYKEIKRRFNVGKDALIILKANHSSKRIQQQFQKFMDQNIFPTLQSLNMNRPLYNIEYKLRCIINTIAPKENFLRLPQLWENFNINRQSKVMIAGGKSVGKSTLLRFLLNKYISAYPRILLIDLDIGQPEIFLPETISCTLLTKPLIGPGFLFNLQPDKAFAIGHVDILLCSPTYVQATQKLISYCLTEQEYKDIPWLINTMGYNRGFALELMAVILQQLPLTDLIQLQSNKGVNNFSEFLYADVLNSMQRHLFLDFKDKVPGYRLHIWESPILQESSYQKQWRMSAKDTRYAILLTRLAAAFINDEEWLTDCQPIGASLDEVKFVKLLESEYEEELVIKASNVNLVYLCHYTEDGSVMECFGIGVVRAIDYNIRRVFLIPAMPFDQLKYVNCLSLGGISLPSTLFTTQGSKVKNKARFVYDTLDVKSSKAVQHFHRRPFNFPKNL